MVTLSLLNDMGAFDNVLSGHTIMFGSFGYLRLKTLTAIKMAGSVLVWQGIFASSFLFIFRFQNAFRVFKILF